MKKILPIVIALLIGIPIAKAAFETTPIPFQNNSGSFYFNPTAGIGTTSVLSTLAIQGTGVLGGWTYASSTGTVLDLLDRRGYLGLNMASFGANDNSPFVVSGNSQTSAPSGDGSLFTGPFRIDFSSSAALLIGSETNTPFGPYIQAGNQSSHATYPLLLNPDGGGVSVSSSTPNITNALLTVGPNTANGTSTISTGKLQFDGYNSAGTHVCAYVSGTAWVITSGACANP